MKNYYFILAGALILAVSPAVSVPAHTADPQCISLNDAKALGKEGKYLEAIDKAKQILRQEPAAENKRTLIFLGLMYYKAGMNTEALAQFKEVSTRFQNSAMSYYFMGMIYEAMAVKEQNSASAREFKLQALNSWQKYISSAELNNSLPPPHTDIGISREESIKRAHKHIELLQEALR